MMWLRIIFGSVVGAVFMYFVGDLLVQIYYELTVNVWHTCAVCDNEFSCECKIPCKTDNKKKKYICDKCI
jgi:hypothetical protein